MPNLPRGPEPMTGLHPGALPMQTLLQEPVTDDERAADLLSWVAYLQEYKHRLKAWCEAQVERVEQAEQALADSPAVKSLGEYVKKSTGKKTLKLPGGTISVRTMKESLVVHNESLVLEEWPELGYIYQPPPRSKLDKKKLRELVKGAGGQVYASVEEQPVLVAELKENVEHLTVKPSAEMLDSSAGGPRLLLDLALQLAEAERGPAQRALGELPWNKQEVREDEDDNGADGSDSPG